MKILIVEDEYSIGATLQEYLQHTFAETVNDTVVWASNLLEAQKEINKKTPDLTLMDIMLPDGNGYQFVAKTNLYKKSKVVFLSALNDPETRVKALESGGSEYISKPFSLKEIKIRISRLRSKILQEKSAEIIKIKNIIFNFKSYKIKNIQTHKEVEIHSKEKKILEILVLSKNEVVSRDEIINKVWGENVFPSNRTVDNYIVKLRKALIEINAKEIKIESIRSIGYKLNIH